MKSSTIHSYSYAHASEHNYASTKKGATLVQFKSDPSLWGQFGRYRENPDDDDKAAAVLDFAKRWSNIIIDAVRFLTSEGLACSKSNNCGQVNKLTTKQKELSQLLGDGKINFAPTPQSDNNQ